MLYQTSSGLVKTGPRQTDRKADAVVIKSSDLNRIREIATTNERQLEIERQKRMQSEFQDRIIKSKERKEKMLILEEERKKRAYRL
jgi:hypothetical protein